MKKVWIFGSERIFTKAEETEIITQLSLFLKQWRAHGKDLSAKLEIIDNQFVKVLVDESLEEASGCSIDSLVGQIKQLEKSLDLVLLNRMNVFYKLDNQIKFETLPTFKEKVKKGIIPKNAFVYHTGVSNEEAFQKEWMLPLEKTWAKDLVIS